MGGNHGWQVFLIRVAMLNYVQTTLVCDGCKESHYLATSCLAWQCAGLGVLRGGYGCTLPLLLLVAPVCAEMFKPARML